MRALLMLIVWGLVVVAPTNVNARIQGHAKHRPAHRVARVHHSTAGSSILNLQSASVLVLEQPKGTVLLAHNENNVTPIASITKLMTAMVTLDGKLAPTEIITIDKADVDTLKGTRSRLTTGSSLTRYELLRLALMSSENRAAAALARTYPGGRQAFVAAMNQKAQRLGMTHTRFVDPAGLSRNNLSTAQDLGKMVGAASGYALIREFTTTASHTVNLATRRAAIEFKNTNRLVQAQTDDWNIELSKTGYTAEAGRCLVMQARINSRPVIIVLLDAWGKLSPVGDANRIRRWMEARATGRRVS